MNIDLKYAEQNRALLETLRLHRSNKNRGHIVLYSTLLIGHTQRKGKCVSHRSHLCPRNCGSRIARIWCLSVHQEYLKARFSSGWITSGSANFCCCSKSIQRQTQACSTLTVPMFQCWKSTLAHENQVIFCIFDIFCIF